MRDNLLFSYDIEHVKVNVYHREYHKKLPSVNKEFYNGVVNAIAEYLFYPCEVIAPRVKLFSVDFEYDKEQLDEIVLVAEEYIAECTKESFLSYMEKAEDNAAKILPEHITRPDLDRKNISFWCDALRRNSEKTETFSETLGDEMSCFKWVKFTYDSGSFYGRYKGNGSDALLVSLPGYNSEWNDLSAYINGEYDILQLSPLGYNTPSGFDESKRVRGAWPVLYDTVSERKEDVGYNKWFFEVCLAIKEIKKPGQKLLFLGTSQGGGAALIMSSVFNDCTIACAAEMPFLIGFSSFNYRRVKNFVAAQIGDTGKMIYDFWARERMFVIDPMMHSERIKCPTLLVSGEFDHDCRSEDIYKLYQVLDCKKEYIELKGQGHGYSEEFKELARRWINTVI